MNFTRVILALCGMITGCWFLSWYKNGDWATEYGVRTSSGIKRTETNWSIIYDEESVYKTIHTIHKQSFNIEENDKCRQRPPGAYIVGVAKSGTRELSDFLHIHPQIVIRTIRPDGGSVYMLPHDLFTNVKTVKNKILDWLPCTYSNQLGLVKADRFFFMDDVAQSLKTINPNMKIIVILREPISRLISHIRFHYHGNDKDKLYNLIKSNVVDRKGHIKYSKHLKTSIYVSGLKIYLKYFSRDQILFVDGNNLKLDPVGVIKNVTEFLGLKEFPVKKHFVLNREKGFYCIRNPEAVDTMNCYGDNRGVKIPLDLQPGLKQKLVNFFAEKNEEFFTLAGQRFDWIYQD